MAYEEQAKMKEEQVKKLLDAALTGRQASYLSCPRRLPHQQMPQKTFVGQPVKKVCALTSKILQQKRPVS